MHWFDRVSRGMAAVETPVRGSTRRDLLKGAALASVAVPLIGTPSASAAPAVAPRTVGPGGVIGECENCLARVNNRGNELIENCSKPGAHRLARPKGGGKKKKIKASEAARRSACQANARNKLAEALRSCGYFYCEAPETEPVPTPGGGPTCAPGTKLCSNQLCCYGGDNCCPSKYSPEGFVCCADVIGCGCAS
jgi:hypothetical protein